MKDSFKKLPNEHLERHPHRGLPLFTPNAPPTVLIDAQRSHPLSPDALDLAQSALPQGADRAGELDFPDPGVLLPHPRVSLVGLGAVEGELGRRAALGSQLWKINDSVLRDEEVRRETAGGVWINWDWLGGCEMWRWSDYFRCANWIFAAQNCLFGDSFFYVYLMDLVSKDAL